MRIHALALLAWGLAACAPAPVSKQTEGLAAGAQIAQTAHPLATDAALGTLAKGGSAIDAAIAAQMVLGLVESQSSGIGGGTLVLHWDAKARKLTALDGLAAAPARATASLRTDTDGKLLPSESVQRGGRAVGVPGTLAAFKMAHDRHGKLAWRALFDPAIAAAEKGFALPPSMHRVLANPEAINLPHRLGAHLFGADGKPLPQGTVVRDPDYAKTMRRIAEHGPDGWLRDGAAQRIVAAAQFGFRPSLMTEEDLRAFRANDREPICGPFLVYTVCTMSPPSYGGIAILQILQMVEARAGGRYDLLDPAFAHLWAEAGKLALADRYKYLGDPAFVAVPVRELVAPAYVRTRAALIDPTRAAKDPPAGEPFVKAAALALDHAESADATSQITIIDREGNVAAITTTVNLFFGSRIMVEGVVLNNAMTNFSAAPKPGEVLANQMASGKRPITSMAPAIVFDRDGRVVAAGGSAGGGHIVFYVAQALIEILANDRSPTEALARPYVSGATRGKLILEEGTPAATLAEELRAKGHDVQIAPLASGLGFVKRVEGGWIGAADPRRDGTARTQ